MATLTVNASALLVNSFASLQQVDYSKLFEIAKAVKDNNQISEFEQNPEGYSNNINGFVVPEGFHMHIVDKDNKYYPEEDDALNQLIKNASSESWTRIEVRAGYKDLACIICLWCGGGSVA
ncbi:hypothetical protein KW811_22110 [Enterobacter quasiroggenkampii]|uniref:hypothetical protein n=1 Tax=Enterobacter quasiroggenkampii TaxID=2497436 RepID=UPI0021D02161|nr:hypothetical protein [Enterobacter quasiroggenkampii]MCU6401182.1 hypothetical protein [Enterobacter quasiroggenkampii]